MRIITKRRFILKATSSNWYFPSACTTNTYAHTMTKSWSKLIRIYYFQFILLVFITKQTFLLLWLFFKNRSILSFEINMQGQLIIITKCVYEYDCVNKLKKIYINWFLFLSLYRFRSLFTIPSLTYFLCNLLESVALPH